MIDSHCHLDIAAFDADRDAVLARARAAGVTGILVPAIRPRAWPTLRTLAAATPDLRIALGIHPQIVPELDESERAIGPETLARELGDAVAVGECGLDGATEERELQIALFRMQIRAARLAKRPLVVHVLHAHDLAPRILDEERAHEVGGVMHSYSGGPELVPVYRKLGFAFSFAGPITYPNARKPVAAARAIPDELLLAETDAPDQAPATHRGQRSEPAYLPEIIAGLAAARGVEPAAVAALTIANTRRLFAW